MDNQAKGKANPAIKLVQLVERLDSSASIAGYTTDAFAIMAFNGASNSLYLLNQAAQRLDQVPAGSDGKLPPSAQVSASFDIKAYGIQNSEGMAFDPNNGRLFLLDPTGKRMIVVTPDAVTVTRILPNRTAASSASTSSTWGPNTCAGSPSTPGTPTCMFWTPAARSCLRSTTPAGCIPPAIWPPSRCATRRGWCSLPAGT
jgi:hypothetical protein